MEITNVMDYEEIARQKLPKMVFDYYESGAEDQWTLKENQNAFSRILFRLRILVDVSKIDMTTTVLGCNISMPIMIAPISMHKMAHPEGECATAGAASAAGTIMTSKQNGAAGIIVSNHGGRQLDNVPATIVALEEVVKAAKGQVPVFLDGGIRRRTDVFKSLALGASGIFIGRSVVFSLAAEGEAGVRKVLQMLLDEFELTMALSGCCSLKEITRNHIVTNWDPPGAVAGL